MVAVGEGWVGGAVEYTYLGLPASAFYVSVILHENRAGTRSCAVMVRIKASGDVDHFKQLFSPTPTLLFTHHQKKGTVFCFILSVSVPIVYVSLFFLCRTVELMKP